MTEEKSGHRFSNADLKKLIIPLFLEQLLVMLVGIADTFMVSFAGDAAVSGVSLVNMFVTFFIYVFTALRNMVFRETDHTILFSWRRQTRTEPDSNRKAGSRCRYGRRAVRPLFRRFITA